MTSKFVYIGENTYLADKVKTYLASKGLEIEHFNFFDEAKPALMNGHIGAILDVRSNKDYSQEDIINDYASKINNLRNKSFMPIMGILSSIEEENYSAAKGKDGLWLTYEPLDRRDLDSFIIYALGGKEIRQIQ